MTVKPPFYITTPIYYVNGTPHIGHAYTTIAADTIARYKRLTGHDVFFATGTDEHGQKIFHAATQKNMSPQTFVDHIVSTFKVLWDKLALDYTDFIRTTDTRHKTAVHDILQMLYDKGDIYKGDYEGLYCMPCESFFTALQAKKGLCPDCGRPLETVQEDSYFFRMSHYQEWLIDYIKTHDFIVPATRKNEILSFLTQPLSDLCISRNKQRLAWGIPLPFDTDHVTYVWVDALINYISVLNFHTDKSRFDTYWPCDIHLIGKDILRPHAVYWPMILKALDLPLPKKIFAHGWWKMEGEKISKSKGNAIDPDTCIATFGLDAFRYFLLREVPFGADGSFSYEKIMLRTNSDLANNLGNLVSRTVGMLEKYTDGVVPGYHTEHQTDTDISLATFCHDTFQNIAPHMEALAFHEALQSTWCYITRMNAYIEEVSPWKLAKNPDAAPLLDNVLFTLSNAINYISILIYPFMPTTSAKIRQQFCLPDAITYTANETLADYLVRQCLKPGQLIKKQDALFPKIEE